jgi:DnaJ-domain-containing protein 1
MLGEASFGDVSGSEDFKAFTADALDALVKVHQQGALTASEEYRKVAADKFAERSSSTIENITQLDSLGKSLQEVVGIQQLVEGESLKSIEDSIGNMRDGPEKDEAVDGLNEAREGLQELIDDEAKDMDEYKSEADKIK